MGKVQINAEDLAFAMENAGQEMIWFLNLETGEIGSYFDGMLNGEDVDEDFDLDEHLDLDVYRVLQPFSSRDSFQVMEDFVVQLAPGRAQDILSRALSGSKPFRRFREAIYKVDPVEKQWFGFRDQANVDLARRWLADEEIDAELVFPKALDPDLM